MGNCAEIIPVIDLSIISGKYEDVDNQDLAKISQEFGKAMSGIGFAYLINHGVDMNKVEHVHSLSKQFFELPTTTKQKYNKKLIPSKTLPFHGYSGPGDEFVNDNEKAIELREVWDCWGTQAHDPAMFPNEIPGLKPAFDDLRSDCGNLGKKLLRCMGQYLKLEDESFFVKNHRNLDDPTIKSHTDLRGIYYYPMDPTATDIPSDAMRCGEHCDWGTISLLFQDMVGGLEVKRADGGWTHATPIQDSVLINCAELMELWSGGIFPATPHRVRILKDQRNLKLGRQSFIYFINPDAGTEVEPIVDVPLGNKEFAERKTVNAFDHFTWHMENAASAY